MASLPSTSRTPLRIEMHEYSRPPRKPWPVTFLAPEIEPYHLTHTSWQATYGMLQLFNPDLATIISNFDLITDANPLSRTEESGTCALSTLVTWSPTPFSNGSRKHIRTPSFNVTSPTSKMNNGPADLNLVTAGGINLDTSSKTSGFYSELHPNGHVASIRSSSRWYYMV
jgi:hypothetical protein